MQKDWGIFDLTFKPQYLCTEINKNTQTNMINKELGAKILETLDYFKNINKTINEF